MRFKVYWTAERIQIAIQAFIRVNGRYPTREDFDSESNLPSRLTFKKSIGRDRLEWMKSHCTLEELPRFGHDPSIAFHELKIVERKLPGKAWTESEVIKSIDDYIAENGCCPATDLLDIKNELPSNSVFKRLFGMKASRWLSDTYPEYAKKKPKPASTEELIQLFSAAYNRIQPKTAKEFNLSIKDNEPSWQRVASQMKLAGWYDLLDRLGLDAYDCTDEITIDRNISFYI